MTEIPDALDTLVVLANDGMGEADPPLRQALLAKWLELTLQNGRLPGALAFYTRGVHLVVDDSPVLELLRRYEARGVPLIICSTCLEYYGLKERVRVGIVGGMGDIIAAQWKARKVVRL